MRISLLAMLRMMVVLVIMGAVSSLTVVAQEANTFSIRGTVYEYTQPGDSVALGFATVTIPDYGIATTTAADGHYMLKGVPKGKATIKVSYVGKVTIEKVVEVSKSMTLNFSMREENFKLKEVMVTAQASQAGGATSSIIGRNAMDHMQATSLDDVLSLLPGELSTEPNLSGNKEVNIRNIASGPSQ